MVTRLVAMGRVTHRPLETKDLDNDCGRGDWGVLMMSTLSMHPQVVSRCFTTSDSVVSSTSVVKVANHGLVQRHRGDRCARLSM